MDVSIIIINYRCADLIINCLRSVYAFTTGVTFEVIVVDNDPEQGAGAQIRALFPDVRWLDMDYNAGFGRANNAGMALAQGRYFLLLNADTLLVDNVIGRCMNRMDQQQDVAACGALQHYPDLSPMPFYTSFNDFRKTFFILPPNRPFQALLDWLFPEPRYADPEQHDWLVGAFVFVRRDVVAQVGGFDEDFFMYGEDVEWSGRLGKVGKLCYFNDCKFIHLENKNPFRRTHISWINRFSTQMQISNFGWIRKQYGVGAYLVLILHYLSMIPVVFLWKMVINVKKHGNPFAELRTQVIYTKKTRVILRYFWKTLFRQKGFYKIKPSENIDLLTAS
ncbi:hypothetical protein GCM10027275_28250 [Rhabdobacter roseus]|uniref:Glycosyltransferase 2-like domain-containing protein n=1 Tax=Rhabdobacter roseus TaxID=1655419 RepID=A0A840TU31_9BACT|nr:glycosyltransferase [Rhabdobacter roseus]MBB5284773.1 hypothetical protein [Rhabdobacter roseus]